uniref:ABM domain-containing protein n=1 Tax=Ditylum brightwellii TaxID=49249 RepID=A0A7S4TAZ9_9STRA|mmetsp:Transcript_5701/g.7552  ORF Transcript_5701/g.7552 Transcript_5701/m.7552 type:complete len:162 (-) Transcript_5701:688-1173(-)
MKVMTRHSNGRKSTTMIGAFSYFAVGALFTHMFHSMKNNAFTTNSIESTRHPGNAWSLAVKMTFEEKSDLNYILEEWKAVTEYCRKNEPFLLHYEGGLVDSDPQGLTLHMLERYTSKDDYAQRHKSGEEFLKFRPKLKALQDQGKVAVEGYSYQEIGYGFV